LAEYRRTRYLLFRCDEDEPARPSVAVSILTGEEIPLDADDAAALLAVPADRFVPPAPSDDESRLRALALQGVLVSDEPDDRLVELRHREDQLAANGWYLYAALYHSLTRRHGVDLALGERLDQERLRRTAASVARRRARAGRPSPAFHRAPGATAVLELPLEPARGELFALLERRRTARGYEAGATMTSAQLSTVLRTVFGCTGVIDHGGGYVLQKKTSPSGGALHPIEAYPIVRRVEGIAAGVYHYDVEHHALELLEGLTEDEATELLRSSTCGQAHFMQAQVAFVLAARFRRNFWKYWRQKDQYGVLLLDAGHLSQTLYLVSTALGLDAFVTAIVNHDDVGERLGLGRYDEGVLAICGCGVSATASELMPSFRPFAPARPR
jgi:putative peptide maturation dehydrogenase